MNRIAIPSPCSRACVGLLSLLAAIVILPAAATTPIAGTVASNLVDRVVDTTDRIALNGHRARWATTRHDAGAAPADFALSQLSVSLKRTPERQQAFDALLRDQQDPASANYRRWLTPTQIGERFGASQHDIDVVTGWLRSQGLDVDAVANNRLRIRFSGTAATVASAFATPLHYYEVGARNRIANEVDPQVPAALREVIASVDGLSSVDYRPLRRAGNEMTRPYAAAAPQPAASNCQGSTCQYAVFPADFAKIYNLGPLQQQGIDGTGQTIGIVSRARVANADMANFQRLAGLPTKYPTVTIPSAGADPGPAATTCGTAGAPSCDNPTDAVKDQGEATLDVQRAGSVAPGAAISLIASKTVGTRDGVQIATEYAIDTDPPPANILSISFTTCEADNIASTADYLDGLFAQAAMEGISVFVASGDGGAAGCASLDSTPTANERLSANLLCSSGHVTCVGGTEFADRANPTAYWNSANAANYLSALGYIPEGAWNEPLDAANHPQVAATGGGVSVYIAKPSWQIGAGVPGTAGRYTPDVSFNASTREGYFTCSGAEQQNACVVSNNGFSFIAVGGTSASTPSMAGIAALLNQHTGAPQGNLNPRLYALAADAGAAVFHDVSVDSSDVANCSVGTPSPCNNSTPGPGGLGGGLAGYAVGAGYDAATGLGSIDAANLLARWSPSSNSFVNLDQQGLSGAWANPQTDGQGLVMTVLADLVAPGKGSLFGGWFTYDVTAAGGQRWYTIQGDADSASASTTVPIYLSAGGRFDTLVPTTLTAVGQATLSFSDCTHGTMNYVFSDGSGRSGTIPLLRLLPNVACTPQGDPGTASTDFLLSGAWADVANNSGQGLVFEVNSGNQVLFAAWYTYASAANPISSAAGQRWYTLQAAFTPGLRTLDDIGIFDTTGGVFDTAATTATAQVGTANLAFQDCRTATLTYRFTSGANASQSGTLDLSRLGPAPDGCAL